MLSPRVSEGVQKMHPARFGPGLPLLLTGCLVWATVSGAVTPPPPTLPALHVESNARWFATADGTRFDYREISAFSLLSRLLTGEEAYVRGHLRTVKGLGFTVVRVILTLDGAYWTETPLGRSFRSAPDMPGYWEALDTLTRLTAEEGLYLRAVLIGALEPFGGVGHADRRDVWSGAVRERSERFALQAAARLAPHQHVIIELANEPVEIGMRDGVAGLVALGRAVKALAPQTLIGGGAVDGAADRTPRLAMAPFDYVDAHIERDRAVGGFAWVQHSGEYAAINQEHAPKRMPFISGEPVNFGEWRRDGRNADVERSPAVAFGYAAVSRARQFNTNFHYDGGLWTTAPKPETVAAITCYMAALNAFPMLTGTRWRGQESYWKDVWPRTNDPATVEEHVRRGRGPWRVFGTGPYSVAFPEPKGWDWQASLMAPAERLAGCTDGVFDAGIYRKK
jgi:hypothetical protein